MLFEGFGLATITQADKKQKILGILRVSVAILALVVILVVCFKQKDDLKMLFTDLPLKVFLAGLGLFVFANFVISLRWCVLLREQGIKVPYIATLKVHFLGLFYNNVMISSVGGDMLRVWYIAKYTTKRLEAGLSVVVDRLLGLFSLILMAFTFYFLFPVDLPEGESKAGLMTRITPYLPVIWTILAVIAAIIVFLFVYGPSRKFFIRAFQKVVSHRKRVLDAVRLYCRKPFSLAFCIILTFVAQCSTVIGFWMMGKSMGIAAPAKYYFVFFPLSWVIGALPVSIGGIGVLEVGLAGLFAALPGVDHIEGLALALCQRFVFIIGSMPGLLIHITGAHLPSDTDEIFIDSEIG